VRAAYEGGASGICISRNYSEATLATLAAVGEALDEMHIKDTIPDGLAEIAPVASSRDTDSAGSDRVF
jgi:hypothetical protein